MNAEGECEKRPIITIFFYPSPAVVEGRLGLSSAPGREIETRVSRTNILVQYFIPKIIIMTFRQIFIRAST